MTIITTSVGSVEIRPDHYSPDSIVVRSVRPNLAILQSVPREEFLSAVADLPGVLLAATDAELPKVRRMGSDKIRVNGEDYHRQSAEEHRRRLLTLVALLKDAEEYEAEQAAARREHEAEVQKIRAAIVGEFTIGGSPRDDFAAALYARGLRAVEDAS